MDLGVLLEVLWRWAQIMRCDLYISVHAGFQTRPLITLSSFLAAYEEYCVFIRKTLKPLHVLNPVILPVCIFWKFLLMTLLAVCAVKSVIYLPAGSQLLVHLAWSKCRLEWLECSACLKGRAWSNSADSSRKHERWVVPLSSCGLGLPHSNPNTKHLRAEGVNPEGVPVPERAEVKIFSNETAVPSLSPWIRQYTPTKALHMHTHTIMIKTHTCTQTNMATRALRRPVVSLCNSP